MKEFAYAFTSAIIIVSIKAIMTSNKDKNYSTILLILILLLNLLIYIMLIYPPTP